VQGGSIGIGEPMGGPMGIGEPIGGPTGGPMGGSKAYTVYKEK
jgi:hypothetical protein